jgi:uncharacterized protein (TIGR02246 family)
VDEIAQLLAEKHCRDLVLSAADAVDRQDYDVFVALFIEDALLVRPGGEPLQGRDAILASYRAKSPERLTRHLISNQRVTLDSPDSAQSTCMVLLYVSNKSQELTSQGRLAEAGPQLGQFEDQLIRTGQGWRIARRKAWFEMRVGTSKA